VGAGRRGRANREGVRTEMGADGDGRQTERAHQGGVGVHAGARQMGDRACTRVGAQAAVGVGQVWSGWAEVEEDRRGTPVSRCFMGGWAVIEPPQK
jgi:hypothetical protein